MSKLRVYRYDDEDFPDGKVISARGDSFEMLTEPQKKAETTIRSAREGGDVLRSTSLYTWMSEALARRLQRPKKAKFLYELEVDCIDVRHKGDVNQYTEVVQAIAEGSSGKEPAEAYWDGTNAVTDRKTGVPYTEPRIEVLVAKAKVLRKL